jgi:hypothetical protein
MFKAICAMGASLAVAGGALTISGCGSSSSPSSNHGAAASAAAPHTTTLPSGQTLIDAADHTDQVSGYRMSATVKVNAGSGSVTADMSGVVGDHGKVAALTTRETVAGTTFDLKMRSANGVYYMSGVPGLSKIAHGKQWLSCDVADAEKAEGLTGLQNPTSSNPAEFLKYLRTVGSITSVGTATVGGVSTTEYHATIDFDRYAKLVPASQRAAARQTIATLETAIGSHTLPVTAWVDSAHQVRRMQMSIPECIAGEHLSMSMTVNLSDYGDVPSVSVPSPSQAYDITPLLKSQMPNLKSVAGGCTGA